MSYKYRQTHTLDSHRCVCLWLLHKNHINNLLQQEYFNFITACFIFISCDAFCAMQSTHTHLYTLTLSDYNEWMHS